MSTNSYFLILDRNYLLWVIVNAFYIGLLCVTVMFFSFTPRAGI